MVAKKVEGFGGMIPAVDQNLLPETAAALSSNAWLYSGVIAGMNTPTLIKTLQASTTKVYRIPVDYNDTQHLTDAVWLEFQDANTDVLRTQTVGDVYNRYYFASPSQGVPTYNTQTRIAAGNTGANAPFTLGIPAPASAMGLSVSGGASATNRTTAYVQTYVSAYGEEGPPGPSVSSTNKIDANWSLTPVLPVVGDQGGVGAARNITQLRIYRTVTSSQGVATYYLVATLSAGSTPTWAGPYVDSALDSVVAANSALQSTNWVAPPTDLQGITALPNGIFAGFRQNEIWFCEPYRPHAWPPQYALAVEYPIVGLGAVGQMLVVCTQTYPYTVGGINPAVMTVSKIAALEPCLSRGSIVSAPEGVFYASSNGLVKVVPGAVENVTRDICTKDQWLQQVGGTTLATLRAARLGTAYYAWGSVRQGVFNSVAFDNTAFVQQDYTGAYSGVLIDTHVPRVAFNLLSNTVPMTASQNDPWTNELFIIRTVSNVNGLYWVNIADSAPTYEVFKWRSRVWQLMKPDNIGVLRVYFDVPSTAPALNPTPNTALVQTLAADQWGLARLYADGVLIWTRELRASGDLLRLPSGRKYNYVQFEFESRLRIKSFQWAASAKELVAV